MPIGIGNKKEPEKTEERQPSEPQSEAGKLQKQVEELTAEKERLAKENEQLAKELEIKAPPKIKGFLIDVGDPFGEGAIRAYRSAGGKSRQQNRLPFVLPEKDPAGKKALESYLLRAEGGGDKKRATIAKKALEKL